MKNFVQRSNSIDAVLANTVKGGDVVILGGLIGVAYTDGDGENKQAVALEGVFELPKATGAITAGAALYYDATNKVVTTTSSGNTAIGPAFSAAASGDATVLVALKNGL